jgi:hypothetical protein
LAFKRDICRIQIGTALARRLHLRRGLQRILVVPNARCSELQVSGSAGSNSPRKKKTPAQCRQSSRRARASSASLQPTTQHGQRVFVRASSSDGSPKQDQPASAPQGRTAGAAALSCRPGMGLVSHDSRG